MAQHLSLAETQGLAGFAQARGYSGQARHDGAQQGQERVEHQRHHSRHGPDAPQNGHRDQQAEDRQAGDRLDHSRQGQRRA